MGFLISKGQLVFFNTRLAASLVFTGQEGEIARSRLQKIFYSTCTNLFAQEEFSNKLEQYLPRLFIGCAPRWLFMPAKAVSDTVEQLGIQKKHWSYELLLLIKHRFGVSAEAFNSQRPSVGSGINGERIKRRT